MSTVLAKDDICQQGKKHANSATKIEVQKITAIFKKGKGIHVKQII